MRRRRRDPSSGFVFFVAAAGKGEGEDRLVRDAFCFGRPASFRLTRARGQYFSLKPENGIQRRLITRLVRAGSVGTQGYSTTAGSLEEEAKKITEDEVTVGAADLKWEMAREKTMITRAR